MMWALLGQISQGKRDAFQKPEIIWGTVGLMAALLVGAFLVWAVDRWRKKSAVVAPDVKEELTDFRAMYERGEITEAEYVRLRDRVARRVKQSLPTDRADEANRSGGPMGTSPPTPPPPPPSAGEDGVAI